MERFRGRRGIHASEAVSISYIGMERKNAATSTLATPTRINLLYRDGKSKLKYQKEITLKVSISNIGMVRIGKLEEFQEKIQDEVSISYVGMERVWRKYLKGELMKKYQSLM